MTDAATQRAAAVRVMLEARTVAVVGASARPGSFGAQLVTEISSGDPAITVFPVNPRYRHVAGRDCLPSLAEVGEPVDLVLLGVPNAVLAEQLTVAAEAGARSAVIYASGHAPVQPGQPSLVERLTGIAAQAGMAVCGGNGMGFWNLDAGVRAIGYAERAQPPRGPVTFVTHSGSAFSSLLRNHRGIGFNLVVSAGQEYVTGLADYIQYALDQPTTRVIAVLMETARDPVRLRAALDRAAAMDVPVVALKVGRSGAGQQMVLAHSGALAGQDAAYEALFDAHGVLRVQDLDELCDTVELLAAGRRAGPGALASVHDSGAERALVVDIAEAVRTPFGVPSEATLDRLTGILEPGLRPDNPLDVWGTGTGTRELFTQAMTILADDEDVAVLALGVDLVVEYDGERAYQDATIDSAAATSKPVVLLSNAASSVHPASAAELRAHGVPVLEGTRSGLLAVRHLLELRDLRARPAVPPAHQDPGRRDAWVARLASGPLPASAGLALLADYHLPVVGTAVARSADEAAQVAARIGFPVAVKTDEPAVAHKSDQGGVFLAVTDETGVRSAYAQLASRFGPAVTVSAMADPGVELALGVVRDPQLGPMVVVAAGGVLVEVLHDRVLAVPPLDRHRALGLLRQLRVWPLLRGVRGRPAVSLDPVLDAVVALGVLAVELGEWLDAVDVNPLVAGPVRAVAVDALVVPRQDRPDGTRPGAGPDGDGGAQAVSPARSQPGT